MPLVVEKTLTSVSRVHGLVRALSANPPQRSKTVFPSTTAATAAPTSIPFSKLSAKISRTRLNRGSQVPSIFTGISNLLMSQSSFNTTQSRSPPSLHRADDLVSKKNRSRYLDE